MATLAGIEKPTGVAVQFRYAFVTDAEGLHTVDITDPAKPRLAATLPIADARNVYVARTYAYVAGGKEGVVIVDVERPEKPFIDQVFDATTSHDVNDVKVGLDERQHLRLRRRRRRRPQDPAAHVARMDAGLRRLQPAPVAAAHRQAPHPRPGAGRSRKASTATAPSTKAATRSRSSTASARAP